MKDYKCFICRDGEAPVRGLCKCGVTYGENHIEAKEVLTTPDLKEMKIPSDYLNVFWSLDELRVSHSDLSTDKRFMKFSSNLSNLEKIIANGSIPSKSYMITAPRGFSKMTFGYSCIQKARMCGYKVFPILDTQQLKRFLTLSVEKPNSPAVKNFNYTYDDFMEADLLIVTVTKDYMRNGAWEVLDQIIDIKSRNDQSVIILNRYSLADITGFDYLTRFNSIVRNDGVTNKRYPVFYQYTDTTMKLEQI